MTIESSKNTFLIDFIKSEMLLRGTTEISKDLLNSAYQKTVKFLSDEDSVEKLKQATRNIIRNGK